MAQSDPFRRLQYQYRRSFSLPPKRTVLGLALRCSPTNHAITFAL
ncbi:CRISPR-associated protein Cas5 [Candidatus Leptofilum sp.]